jgi:hypothetical protein
MTYVTTIRLPIPLYEELKLVAHADGVSVTEAIREAIAEHIEKRRADPEFQKRLKERMTKDATMLKRLSTEQSGRQGGEQ